MKGGWRRGGSGSRDAKRGKGRGQWDGGKGGVRVGEGRWGMEDEGLGFSKVDCLTRGLLKACEGISKVGFSLRGEAGELERAIISMV
jgi:hypothetical protein